MISKTCTLLISASLLCTSNLCAQDDLFKRVFGQSKQTSFQKIPSILTVNGRYLRDIDIKINGDILTGIFLKDYKTILSERLDPAIVSKILSEDHFITKHDLEKVGLNVSFDPDNLVVNIALPIEQTKAQGISIVNHVKGGQVYHRPVSPNKFSFSLNARNSQLMSKKEEDPFRSFLSTSINLNSFILEANGNFDSTRSYQWERRDIRLVKDDERRSVRYQLGDLSYSTQRFLTQRNLSGIGIAKEYSISPNQSITPVNEETFLLKEKSKIEVFVNNRLYQTLTLSPGKYSLTDFPIYEGLNDIRLEITTESGHREILRFPYGISSDLLKKGLHKFSIVSGYEYQDEEGVRNYNRGNTDITTTISHDYGLTSALTSGYFFQADRLQQIFGSKVAFATNIGNFKIEQAFSHNSRAQGYSIASSYFYKDNNSKLFSDTNLSLKHQYTSPHFEQLGAYGANTTHPHLYGIGVRKAFSKLLALNYTFSTSPTRDRSKYKAIEQSNLGLYFNFSRNLKSNANAYTKTNRYGDKENGVSVYLTYSFDSHKQIITAFHDTHQENSKVSHLGNYSHPKNNVQSNVWLEETPSSEGATGRLDYQNHRYDSFVSMSSRKSYGEPNYSSIFGFSFALSYAGGHFAFSRPINNSFAIVTAPELTKDEKIQINPDHKALAPRQDFFSNMVVSNIADYQPYTVKVDHSQLSEFTTIKNDHFLLLPKYKSGFHIPIESESKTSIQGSFFYKEKALALKAGSLVNQKTKKRYEYFTNRSGSFFIEGIKPGTYNILLGHYLGEVTIKDHGKGIFNVGKIQLH